MKAVALKKTLWAGLKVVGELEYLIGRHAGYYWCLRAMCNWCRRDWYGRPVEKGFHKVGGLKL